MILLDTNVVVDALDKNQAHHAWSKKQIEDAVAGDGGGISVVTLAESCAGGTQTSAMGGVGVGEAKKDESAGERGDGAAVEPGNGDDDGVDWATIEDGQPAHGGLQFESKMNHPIAGTRFPFKTEALANAVLSSQRLSLLAPSFWGAHHHRSHGCLLLSCAVS